MLRICNLSILNALKRNTICSKVTSTLVNDRKYDSTVPVFFLFKDFLHPEYFNVIAISRYFEFFHTTLGIPWFMGIISGTIIMKGTISFPIQYAIEKNSVEYKYLLSKMTEIEKEADVESEEFANQQNMPEFAKQKFMKLMRKQAKQKAYIDHNCHPMKPLVFGMFQAPLWITTSFTMRAMLARDDLLSDLQNSGALWFTSLMNPDPYMVFPLLFFVGNFVNHEIIYGKTPNPTYVHMIIRLVSHFSSLFLLLISSNFPLMMTLYWCTSTWCHLVNNLLLVSPRVRQLLNIRKLESDTINPYHRIWNNIKTWRNKK